MGTLDNVHNNYSVAISAYNNKEKSEKQAKKSKINFKLKQATILINLKGDEIKKLEMHKSLLKTILK